jgi:methionyl-tRNA formyltransferase
LSLDAVFMGKNKRSAARALAYLVERGVDVRAVVAAEPDELTTDAQRLDLVAEKGGLPLTADEDLYAAAQRGELSDVDLIVSFLFWKRIREPLISLPRVGCLNFHPAPLPDIRGVGGYNVAILEDLPEWGVSAHFVDEDIDTGDLVAVERFPIDRNAETAFSLDVKSQERLFELFCSVVDHLLAGEELPRAQQGDGRYFTREDLEELRRVRPGDDLHRKIRAFWYPPHPGATIEVDGREATLVDGPLLEQVAELYRRAGEVP